MHKRAKHNQQRPQERNSRGRSRSRRVRRTSVRIRTRSDLFSSTFTWSRCRHRMDRSLLCQSETAEMSGRYRTLRHCCVNEEGCKREALIDRLPLGKTSFARSLPGPLCHFKGSWRLDTWDPNARFLLFDDIPWDDFEKRNYPSKKDLLSASGSLSMRF